MSRIATFLNELRRRRVLRVAALYTVGAWVALQVTDLALPGMAFPDSAIRFFWIAALLGFPVALVFGWRFDIVGGRIIRTPSEESEVPDWSLHRADYLILGALAIVAAAITWDLIKELGEIQEPGYAQITPQVIDPQSIALLPFSDQSTADENAAFLASGIHDDLLTMLSKISSFRVISRTSVERYRNTTKSIPAIGRELGVAKIVEGRVQRSGGQIRINVQLIDSAKDEHLWAATYDRSLTATNVFAIQTEIAEAIADQLQATITPEESSKLTEMPTRNFAAYTAYLKGKKQADIESVESVNAAVDSFKTALNIDPNFALAYVGLADAYLTLAANFRGGLPTDESNALAEPPIVMALELNENLGAAYATLGLLRQQQGNLQAAEQAYKKAITLQPNYSRAFRLYGRLRWQQGARDEALELLQKALTIDPFSATVNYDIGRIYDETGQFEQALTRFLRVIEIEPDYAFAYVYIAAIHYLVYGHVDESLIWYHRAAENDAMSPSLQAAQAIAYLEIGSPDHAREWVDKGLRLGPKIFWPVWGSLLVNTYINDDAAAERDARTLLDLYPRNWGALYLLRNADMKAGRYEAARSRYARAFRELVETDIPEVSRDNYQAAVDFALVLMNMGQQERADKLLEGSLKVIETLPRMGTNGYWITDVKIYALQHDRQRAHDALREAVDQGWRFLSWYYLDRDPNLNFIREDPEFRELQQIIKADMAEQAKRVQELEASGDL
jgi:TolB-like protein/tetratricopeptide (TPR) repeat protein